LLLPYECSTRQRAQDTCAHAGADLNNKKVCSRTAVE